MRKIYTTIFLIFISMPAYSLDLIGGWVVPEGYGYQGKVYLFEPEKVTYWAYSDNGADEIYTMKMKFPMNGTYSVEEGKISIDFLGGLQKVLYVIVHNDVAYLSPRSKSDIEAAEHYTTLDVQIPYLLHFDSDFEVTKPFRLQDDLRKKKNKNSTEDTVVYIY